MNSMSTTLFAKIPKLENLCYIRLIFSNMQMTHEIFKQVFHCQIICCRDIIKLHSKVIASPIPDSDKYAYVIMSKKFYESKKLQEYLKMRFINHSDPREVNFDIYKMCLKYSIVYKLLPNWIKFSEYLCKSKSSIEQTEELNAITFDLDVKEEGMYLKFNPLKIKLFPLSLETINVSKPTLEKFRNKPKTSICFRDKFRAFMLPSFNNCNLHRVTKEIPNSCEFRSYDAIRDHWKHMYGIDMPASPEGIDYYEVTSPEFDNRIFVFPRVCLQTALPKIVECINQSEILDIFLEDLKVKVPQICGKELFFEYHCSEPRMNFIKPKEAKSIYFLSMQRGVNDTPSRSSLIKSSCFNSKFNKSNVYNYDSKTLKNLSYCLNFDSPTKSLDSNSGSFSFQNKFTVKRALNEEAKSSSRNEFVKYWLLNSCVSPGSSIETESSKSRNEFENASDSPLRKIKRLSVLKKPHSKPTIRSIESVKISLSDLRQGTHNLKNEVLEVENK